MEEIKNLTVTGVNHYYKSEKVVILFDDETKYLTFSECSLIFDSGIIGQKIKIAEEYNGEMGFVIGLKSIGLDADDYKYFLLKGEDGQEHYQNQIRIACKSFEVGFIGKGAL